MLACARAICLISAISMRFPGFRKRSRILSLYVFLMLQPIRLSRLISNAEPSNISNQCLIRLDVLSLYNQLNTKVQWISCNSLNLKLESARRP